MIRSIISALLIGVAALVPAGAGANGPIRLADDAPDSHVVVPGDTLWGIVAKVATDKEDMSKLTWQVMQDNRISDPGHLQPGTELIIRVQKAREL